MNASIIDKIAKLRRLSTSNNVHEAAAAAAAADKLMQEHGIAEAELEAAGEAPKEKPVEEQGVEWVGRVSQWQLSLAMRLVRHYDCSCYGTNKRAQVEAHVWRPAEQLHIIGRPSDIANVRYMYAWLVLEIERLAKKNAGNGRAWINSFKHGAVAGVYAAMTEEKQATMVTAKATATSAAIVLLDNRAIEARQARDAMHPNLRSSGRVGGATSAGGYGAGQTAGRALGAQHKGLSAGGTRSLKA